MFCTFGVASRTGTKGRKHECMRLGENAHKEGRTSKNEDKELLFRTYNSPKIRRKKRDIEVEKEKDGEEKARQKGNHQCHS